MVLALRVRGVFHPVLSLYHTRRGPSSGAAAANYPLAEAYGRMGVVCLSGGAERGLLMRSHLRLCLAVLLAAALAGCGDFGAGLPGPSARKEAPAVGGPDSSGKEVALADYRGKVVLVDFWRDT